MRCDVLAQGVVEAVKEINLSVPLVVRLAGTNFKEGKEILDKSNLKILSASDLNDAAKKIVDAKTIDVKALIKNIEENTVVANENQAKAVTGVAYSKDEAKITIIDLVDQPGIAAKIFRSLSNQSINVDMIVQNNFIERKKTNMTFTVPMSDLNKSLDVISSLKSEMNFLQVLSEDNLSKVSIIGSGMRNQPGIAAKMFECLSAQGINIEVISTSEIKVSVLIEKSKTNDAVNALHDVFELDKP